MIKFLRLLNKSIFNIFMIERERKKREREKREREKKKRERDKRERERDFKYLLTLILTGGHK